MIAVSDNWYNGWAPGETTSEADYGTAVVVVVGATTNRTDSAEIVKKAVEEFDEQAYKEYMEGIEQEATEWPIAPEPNAGIGSRKSPIAKARSPPERFGQGPRAGSRPRFSSPI